MTIYLLAAVALVIIGLGDIILLEVPEIWWNLRQYYLPRLNVAKKRRPPRRHWRYY